MANVANQQGQNGSMAAASSESSAMVLGSDAYRGALEPTSIAQAWQIAETMASFGFCGVKSPAEALGRIMTGRGIGLSAMQSLRGVYTINERPGLDASLMHALCLASPLCEKFAYVPEESNDMQATFIAQRKGDAPVKHTFTLEQAKAMGVLDRNNDDPKKREKDVWQTQRAAMLRARCKAELARLVFPDLTFGMYSREEFDAGVADIPGPQKDPNELAAEILSQEEAAAETAAGRVTTIQTPARDFAKESADLKERMRAATSRQEKAAAREAFTKWDAPEQIKKAVLDFYNELISARKAEKGEKPAAEATTTPNLVGDENLFSGPK